MPKITKIKVLIFGVLALVLIAAIICGLVLAVGHFKRPVFVYDFLFGGKQAKISLVHVRFGNETTSYFGEIARWEKDFLVLKNPIYLDVRQGESATSAPIVTIRRLAEDFSPRPEAKIFKENIIFIQELTPDSDFYKAYQQNAAQ